MTKVLVLEGRPVSKKNGWAPSRGVGSRGLGMYQRKKEVKGYVEACRIQAVFQMRRLGLVKISKPTPVAIRLKVYFAAGQGAMDVHNAAETVLDALQGVCYDNDLQVVGHHYPPQRLVDAARPRVEVELQRAEDAQLDPRWAE